MKNSKQNVAKLQSYGQLNNIISIEEPIPSFSLSYRRQQNLKNIQAAEKSTKDKQKYSEQQLLEYYVAPKKIKVKDIYKDVERTINLQKDIILPKLKLEKINLYPPQQEQSTSPGKRRKKQYHYFVKTPLSNSINLKDLSTRSSHHNKSQFKSDRLDLSTPLKESTPNRDFQKKSILLNELTKVTHQMSGNKHHKKITFKRGTLENEFGSELKLDDEQENTQLNLSRISSVQGGSLKKKEEEQEEDTVRYNLTFRGSVQMNQTSSVVGASTSESVFKKATFNSLGKHHSNKSQDSLKDSSSSSNNSEDEESDSNKNKKSEGVISSVISSVQEHKQSNKDDNQSDEKTQQNLDSRTSNVSNQSLTHQQKMKLLANRLSMQPFLNQTSDNNPNSLQIKYKLKLQHQSSTSNGGDSQRASIFSQEQKDNLMNAKFAKNLQDQLKTTKMLHRQKTMMTGNNRRVSIESQENTPNNIGNEGFVDEQCTNKFRERLQSLTGRQLDEIQRFNEIEMEEKRKNKLRDEFMLKLSKREQAVENQLKKDHKRLFNIAIKVKKSNQLDDEYKDINLFQKNIGYSLPIIHTLKYFDVNSGQYKYLQGRSSLNEEVKPEYNEYYQMLGAQNNQENEEESMKHIMTDY